MNKKEIEQLVNKAVVTAVAEVIKNINTNDNNATQNKQKPKQQERIVNHPYNHYKDVINTMTAKELAGFISKKQLKDSAFPVNYEVGRDIFTKYEIGGRPWISYDEQITQIVPKLMDYYKYKKQSKISKYNDMLKYLQERITKINEDKKLKPQFKKHRVLSVETAQKLINEKLEELL